VSGRNTSGVRLIRLDSGDRVAAIAVVTSEDDEDKTLEQADKAKPNGEVSQEELSSGKKKAVMKEIADQSPKTVTDVKAVLEANAIPTVKMVSKKPEMKTAPTTKAVEKKKVTQVSTPKKNLASAKAKKSVEKKTEKGSKKKR